MKIGVLMIGSLYWDPQREAWRRARLVDTDPLHVSAPIRYGRLSRTQTYTMVFSAGMKKERFGQAIARPFRQWATTVDELLEEATHLWAAESNRERTERISASWGCVALLPNPRRELPQGVLAGWKAYVTRKCRYPRLEHAEGEPAAVSESGILKISWPRLADGTDLDFDALLGTATDPKIENGEYPTDRVIAKAWTTPQGKRHISYFDNNVSRGITTEQDGEIKRWLERFRMTQEKTS